MKNVGLEQRRSSNRLSSGYRINSAADDAAGLAISETMRAQIRGLDQASRNTQDGQAMLVVTEGGLDEMSNILQRVRELLVQASNDTNTQNQREMIGAEVYQLSLELNEMVTRVEFNANQVLNIGDWEFGDIDLSTTITETGAEFTDFDMADLHEAIAAVLSGRGADTCDIVTNAPAETDATVAWFQVGANQSQGITFDFARVSGIAGVAGAVVTAIAEELQNAQEVATDAGVETGSGIGFGAGITLKIETIQAVLDGVNIVRAELGASQNRMDHTMRSLDLSSENLQDAESRVRNADIAREMMRFTMTNVLQQAAVSMLAQANQLPNNLLQLLR
jgi:flagellin